MQFDIPESEKSIIKVIGVGGGGSNAVNYMHRQGIVGVDFAICNTDNQAMEISEIPVRIQLGPHLTEGRGAGSKPQIGKQACIESIEEIRQFIEDDTKMLFITAGMGGGTGTGAAPIIAKTAKELDILTVAIVTLPFRFEGKKRLSQAREGLNELKKNVDAIIIISNDKLKQIYGGLAASQAFAHADNVLLTAAKGIAEIITVPGYINVDFEDVNTVMRDSGVAIMGTGIAEGDKRAQTAIHQALNSPLLEDNDIRGARHILLNISSGTKEVTMDEIYEITEYVQEESGEMTDLIWGNCYDETLGEKICVTVIATGFDEQQRQARREEKRHQPEPEKIVVSLDDGIDAGFEKGVFEIEKPAAHLQTFQLDVEVGEGGTHKGRNSNAEPYVRADHKTETPNVRRLKQPKLNNPQTVIELENEPAYKRRKVQLENVPHSSENTVSRTTISVDDDPVLRKGSPFLHDNVD